MKIKLINIIGLFGLIFVFQASKAFACTCMSPAPIYQTFDKSAAVFSGKVVSLDIADNEDSYINSNGEKVVTKIQEKIYRLEISETFKGKKEKFIDLNLGSPYSSCESRLTVGENYLIYASKRNDENFLRDGSCSRSLLLEHATDQIEIIREKLAGKPEAKIYGSISRVDTFPNTTKTRVTDIKDQVVTLRSNEKEFAAKTDKRGIFKFNDDLPDGDYILSTKPGSDFYAYPESVFFKVANGKISSDTNGMGFVDFYDSFYAGFSLSWDNKIEGKIFDGIGKPVKWAAVRLIPVAVPFEKIESDEILDGNEDGEFSDSQITPGKYYLVAEIYAPFNGKDKVRIFYPQAETPEKATQIEIKATSKLNFDIILPQKYVLREIKGNITWSDGQPADNAEMRLFKSKDYQEEEFNDEIENSGCDKTITDDFGNFVLVGFENEEYWIHFEDDYEVITGDESEDVTVKGNPVKIKVEKNNQPLKLMLIKP